MSEAQESDTSIRGAAPGTVAFDYIKSYQFRVVHADGVWGGVTNQGNVQIAFFSERQAIPRRIVHRVEEDSTLGPEIEEERVTRGGFVREVEVDVVMNLGTAVALRDWLSEKLRFAHEVLSIPAPEETKL
jgi:hypothetical protein